MNFVVATVDFGATFTQQASTTVTGQGWVTSASKIIAIVSGANTDPDEIFLLQFTPVISNLVDGVGFTVTLFAGNEAKGTYDVVCSGA